MILHLLIGSKIFVEPGHLFVLKCGLSCIAVTVICVLDQLCKLLVEVKLGKKLLPLPTYAGILLWDELFSLLSGLLMTVSNVY